MGEIKILIKVAVLSYCYFLILFCPKSYAQKLTFFSSVPAIQANVGASLFRAVNDKLWIYPEGGQDSPLTSVSNSEVVEYPQNFIGILNPEFLDLTLDSTNGNLIFISSRFTFPNNPSSRGGILTFNGSTFTLMDRSNLVGFNSPSFSSIGNSVFSRLNNSIYFSAYTNGIWRKSSSVDSFNVYRVSSISPGNLGVSNTITSYDNKILSVFNRSVFITDPQNSSFETKSTLEVFGTDLSLFEIQKTHDSTYIAIDSTGNCLLLRNGQIFDMSTFGVDSLAGWISIDKRGVAWLLDRNNALFKIKSKSNVKRFDLEKIGFPSDHFVYRITVDTLDNKWLANNLTLYKISDVNCQFQPIQSSGCKGQSLFFASKTTTIGDGIKTYIWKFGNAPSETFSAKDGDTVSYSFQNPGTYRVKLIAIDSNGVIDSAFQQVNILNSPGVQINAPNSLLTCKNAVSLSTINGFNPVWYLPDGSTMSGSQIHAKMAGLYVVRDTLTIDSVSCFSTDSVLVIRSGIGLANIEFSNSINGNLLSESIYRDEATSILINGTPSGSPFSMVINGTDLQKNPAIIAVGQLSKIDVTFNSMNQDSCWFSITKTLIINDRLLQPDFVPILPNLITSNGDNVNEKFTDKSGSFPSGFTLEVFNRWGKSIFKKDNYQNEWPQTGTKTGLYFYLLSTPEGTKYSGWVEVML